MTDYTLELDDSERMRYRIMAALALQKEGDLWEAAGIVKGARVVDLGCGPGAVLVELARLVGPEGQVVGVDQDAEARDTAAAWAAESGLGNVEIVAGQVTATGLPTGEWDAVMLRHVLIHNGPRVGTILGHVRDLLKPGGHVVLNEVDATGFRFERDMDPDVLDLGDRWWEAVASHGNDIAIGPRLGALAEDNGFQVVERRARYDHFPLLPQMRPPAWAARQAILDADLCTDDDIARWDAALDRYMQTTTGNIAYMPNFTVLARRPA